MGVAGLELSVFLMVLKTDSSSCKFCCILAASWFQDVQKTWGRVLRVWEAATCVSFVGW